ncbi:MAG: HEAT repeat domain-containing protein [Caldilineaceae bacterium]
MRLQHQLLRTAGYALAVAICIVLLFFVIGVTWIGFDVKSQCQQARREYGGDCTEALSHLVQDDTRGFRVRNEAIWALGQLGDGRALPVLQSLYTGKIPPREPLDAGISQYELRKAVALTSGGQNPLAIFWRHGID